MELLAKEGKDLLEQEDSLETVVARNQFIKGVNLARLEQWGDAYPPLLDAWKHKKHWQIALNLGRVEFELGKYKDAAEHFELVLRAPDLALPASGPDPRAQDRSIAVVWLAKAKSRLAHIHVDAAPRGARILVDGTPAGEAPLSNTIRVDPGRHIVELQLGGSGRSKPIDVASGEEVTVTLRMGLPPALDTSPSPLAEPLPAPFPTRQLVLGVGSGLAVTGLALGTGALVLASEYGHRAAAHREGPDAPYANGEAQNKSLAFWSFVGAGLAAGGTLAYHVLTRDTGQPLRAAAVIRPDSAGIVLSGAF